MLQAFMWVTHAVALVAVLTRLAVLLRRVLQPRGAGLAFTVLVFLGWLAVYAPALLLAWFLWTRPFDVLHVFIPVHVVAALAIAAAVVLRLRLRAGVLWPLRTAAVVAAAAVVTHGVVIGIAVTALRAEMRHLQREAPTLVARRRHAARGAAAAA